jgi:hypothetical protein
MEENCTGSQSPQRTVVLENKKKENVNGIILAGTCYKMSINDLIIYNSLVFALYI